MRLTNELAIYYSHASTSAIVPPTALIVQDLKAFMEEHYGENVKALQKGNDIITITPHEPKVYSGSERVYIKPEHAEQFAKFQERFAELSKDKAIILQGLAGLTVLLDSMQEVRDCVPEVIFTFVDVNKLGIADVFKGTVVKEAKSYNDFTSLSNKHDTVTTIAKAFKELEDKLYYFKGLSLQL